MPAMHVAILACVFCAVSCTRDLESEDDHSYHNPVEMKSELEIDDVTKILKMWQLIKARSTRSTLAIEKHNAAFNRDAQETERNRILRAITRGVPASRLHEAMSKNFRALPAYTTPNVENAVCQSWFRFIDQMQEIANILKLNSPLGDWHGLQHDHKVIKDFLEVMEYTWTKMTQHMQHLDPIIQAAALINADVQQPPTAWDLLKQTRATLASWEVAVRSLNNNPDTLVAYFGGFEDIKTQLEDPCQRTK